MVLCTKRYYNFVQSISLWIGTVLRQFWWKNTLRILGVNWNSYHNEREKWMDATFHCIASILEAWIQTWKPKKTLTFQITNYNTNMSRNRGHWGRLRPWSFCYCDTSIIVSNVIVDTIWQLQASLDKEQTMMATLCQERDEAQNSSWIWKRLINFLQRSPPFASFVK